MTNDNQYLPRGRFQVPTVVLPLLALLIVFLSSVTHQQTSATNVDHGFIGTLDHLVVASHSESNRVPGSNFENGDLADGDPDLPDGWHHSLLLPDTARSCSDCTLSAGTEFTTTPPRFSIPLLRAPPLA